MLPIAESEKSKKGQRENKTEGQQSKKKKKQDTRIYN